MANKWNLQMAERVTAKLMMRGLERFGDIMKEEVADGAPGGIKKTIRVIVGLRNVKVVTDHPGAAFVEFGTPPHVITPKTKKVLRWLDSAGVAIFAKKVNHPGTQPNPFMRRGIEVAKLKMRGAFR